MNCSTHKQQLLERTDADEKLHEIKDECYGNFEKLPRSSPTFS